MMGWLDDLARLAAWLAYAAVFVGLLFG